MARGQPTTLDHAATILDASAANPDLSHRQLSAVTALDRKTIDRLLEKQVPVVGALSQLKRNEMLAGWQWLYFDSLVKVQDDQKMSWGDRRNAAVVLGIATEKVLLLTGQPSQIVGHLHEVRISLPQLAARLADVSRAIVGTPSVVVEGETAG